MKIDSLYQIFSVSINSFADNEKYNVYSIEGMMHKIGKSLEGYPKVFVRTNCQKGTLHNLNGEVLSAEYNIQCSLVDDRGAETDAVFSIITLRTTEESLIKIFFDVFSMMLLTLPVIPSDFELALKIEALLEIFAALKKKSIHKIQGLWTELLVIDNSKDPEKLAEAWHNSPNSKYDFTQGTDKIEVKSTSSEQRIHKFSLDQLNPTHSSRLIIASSIVRESAKDDNGFSVDDLYKKICKKLTSMEARIHVYTVITNTLGDEYAKATEVYFDYSSAKDSLKFYDYHDVPKIDKGAIPSFVSNVKFDSELTHICSIDEKRMVFESGSLLAVI